MKTRYVLMLLVLGMAAVLISCGDSSNPVTPDNSTSYPRTTQNAVPADYVSLGGQVWMDDDNDGIQDCCEDKIPDVTVNLWDCEENMLASAVTDSLGEYLFDNLMAGDYRLQFVAPDHYTFSPMDAFLDDEFDSDVDPVTGFTECLTVPEGVDYANLDAGLFTGQALITGWVWNDENMDGIQSEGEIGLSGIEVQLYVCDSDWLATTVTDADGSYQFDGLEAGDYHLAFANPFGYIFTYQDVGSDDALDSDVDRYQKRTICFSLTLGDVITDWDAGLFAYDGCTYGKGYWKNHAGFGPQADSLSKLLPIWLGDKDGSKSLAVYEAGMAVDLLQQHEYGDPSNGITKLYAHLLTTKLNVANFANPEDIYDAMVEADAFLADHDWKDWASMGKIDRHKVLRWKDMFERYNEGDTGPGACDDHDRCHDRDQNQDSDRSHNPDCNRDRDRGCDRGNDRDRDHDHGGGG